MICIDFLSIYPVVDEIFADFHNFRPATFIVEFSAQIPLIFLELFQKHNYGFAPGRRRVHILGSDNLKSWFDLNVRDDIGDYWHEWLEARVRAAQLSQFEGFF
jgi:hypothetical protein